jgi:hypothetical protein
MYHIRERLSRGIYKTVNLWYTSEMSEEQLIGQIKDLQREVKELKFQMKVVLNRFGLMPHQLEEYRKLEEKGELG